LLALTGDRGRLVDGGALRCLHHDESIPFDPSLGPREPCA
jgi:hypothetical protein